PRSAPYVTSNGSVEIIGYNDMAGILTALNARFVAAHPHFKFALTLKGTRTAPPALARGESAFAPMGAEFSAEELARYRTATGGEPRMFRIAHCSLSSKALSGPLAIIVHKNNPLTALTLPQVRQIFEGTARWSDLGLTGAWAAREIHSCGLRPELALGLFLRTRTPCAATFGPGGYPLDRFLLIYARQPLDPFVRE